MISLRRCWESGKTGEKQNVQSETRDFGCVYTECGAVRYAYVASFSPQQTAMCRNSPVYRIMSHTTHVYKTQDNALHRAAPKHAHRNAENRIVRRERIFILQLCVESPPSVLNMTLPAFVDKRQRLQHGALSYQSISAAYAGAQHSAANAPALSLLLSIDGTDGRTDARPLHRSARHTTRAASVSDAGE